MKALEAIALTDALLPNVYEAELKLRWLLELDGMIYRELLMWHENAPEEPRGYSNESELLASAPYTGLYADYLAAMIHMHDGEFERYTNAMLRFNSAFSAFAADYNRRNMPLKGRGVHQ